MEDGPEGNLGFLPTISNLNTNINPNPNSEDRRTILVDTLREYPQLHRPSRNIDRNL